MKEEIEHTFLREGVVATVTPIASNLPFFWPKCRVKRPAFDAWNFRHPHYGGHYNVFFQRSAHNEMLKHSVSDLSGEVGGALLGNYYHDKITGSKFGVIKHIIPCTMCERSSVDVVFTARFWQYLDAMIEDEYPGLIRMGTYHTHPGYGVFLSRTDKKTILTIFRSEHHVAFVVDPVKKDVGCFIWGPDRLPVRTGYSMFTLCKESLR